MRCAALVAAIAVVAVVAVASPFSDLKDFGYNPLANPSAIVTSGNARFTVLSAYLIRMEYSASGQFEDRATLAVVNRKTPVPNFTSNTNGGTLSIQTGQVTVSYQTGQPFNSGSLTAQFTSGASWHFGQNDDQNLLGTIKSLDLLCNPTLNCTQNAGTRVHSESLHCTWGVVSRNGWTVYDDSKNYILSNVEGQWFDNGNRGVGDVDAYLFGHGMNYKAAVYDLMQIAGKQPMMSKQLYGSWYTRWFDFDNDDVERILTNFKKTQLPLDVLILDMNWHTKDSWTGYTWDKQLYPFPQDTVTNVHNHGLKIGANLHDAVGFGFWEEKYATMAKAMGVDPASQNTVLFNPLNATYMHTMEDQVLAQLGFDIWWIDWQQGGNYGGCDGNQMNPTFITDHVRSTDNIRRGISTRDNILARWGGMGSQRYPVGFSGDVNMLSWQCFSYQPYFVATAANVGYGLISNDLVGPADDHELHVRWMQFGAYSPVMRIHDRGMSSGGCWGSDSCAVVNMWLLPFDYLEPIREVMTERSALQPYIYTMTRKTFDTGLAMVRPMYYEFPTASQAFAMNPGGSAQYMFGDDMFVAPITTQSDEESGLVNMAVWVPPGTWYDDVFGELVAGDTTVNREYTLYDVPRFVRAGAVIPRIANPTDMGVAGSFYEQLEWMIYPGAAQGSGSLYEDDGQTREYITGRRYSFSMLTYTATSGSMNVNIAAANGSYTGQPTARNVRLVLVGVLPAASVTLNGDSVPYQRFPAAGQVAWTYDGKTGNIVIFLGSQSIASQQQVAVQLVQQDTSPSLTSRMKVFAARTMLAKRITDEFQQSPFETTPGPGSYKKAASYAGLITSTVGSVSGAAAVALMGTPYRNMLNLGLGELGGNPAPTPLPNPQLGMLVQLFNHERGDTLLCGSDECISTNFNYQVMFAEGYQPPQSFSGTATLYDYFNSGTGDNYATTSSTSPSGYSPAIFSDGVVYQNSGPGLVCLDVYFLAATGDYLTTASPIGLQWAKDHNYALVQNCIGYVSVAPPSGGAAPTVEEAKQYVARVRKAHRKLRKPQIAAARRAHEDQHAPPMKQLEPLAKHPRGGKTGKAKAANAKPRFGRTGLGAPSDPTIVAIALLQSITG